MKTSVLNYGNFVRNMQTFSRKARKTAVIEHHIKTGLAQPVKLPSYQLSHTYCETVKKELQEMLSSGIIKSPTSKWSAPIVLVMKKDGSMRLCVDYRHPNQIPGSDAYPMLRFDDQIDRVGKSTYISSLDLTRWYWQVPVSIVKRLWTAFAIPFGLHQFNTMPFGLLGAPVTFQRLIWIVSSRDLILLLPT